MPNLIIRKRADKAGSQRLRLYDELTGEPKLVNPDTPGTDHEAWPLAGVDLLHPAPRKLRLSTRWVQTEMALGWVEGTNHRIEVRPAGRADAPWAPTPNAPNPHVFHHYDELVLHTSTGDLRYRVTRQPDKYAARAGDDAETAVDEERYAAGETVVSWDYELELVGGTGSAYDEAEG